ncbi:dATP pyrophosphohydrolase [Reyranella sp. CPCC 100927]|uniref:dATP pyrophosphohydrolase n=1 Tax=Reyranella sp. CPCC 100927 TaxID=2599616 RepID=UPI001C49A8CA|nr:dATP pyrophosphohydrolase [Reyranella sp. CPCC 100927]
MSTDAEAIVVTPVDNARDMRAFIDLPKRLYRGHAGYVPHLDMERRDTFNPAKNPYFQHAQVRFWLARRADRVVGRISAQVDRAHLDRHADATGLFGCMDAEDDPAVYAALLSAAEAWLRDNGMKRIRGPLSLSINEEVGLQIEGFDSRPMLLIPYHPPYAAARVEAQGYAKAKDVVSYDYDVQNAEPTIGRKLIERGGLAGRVKVRTADMKRFDAEVRTLLDIFNDAWSDNWGYVPFTEAEIAVAAKTLKPVVIRDLAIFVDVDGETVAFIVALANLNEALSDLDGKLLPFGWAKLAWRLLVDKPKSARVPLMGVRKKFRNHPLLGAGLAMMAIDALRENGKRIGMKTAELGWILEDNKPTNNIIRSVGGKLYKKHRIYEKALS